MSPFEEVLPEGLAVDRLDKILAARVPGATREAIKRWINEGRVLVDGKLLRPRDKVGPGASIRVEPGPPPATSAEPDPSVVLDVVYEDEHLLVVNKPAGLVVHPGRGHRTGTLVNGLLARPGFERPPSDPLDPEGHFRPGIVHRIDKDTSGLLVVARTEAAREGLKHQLAAHTVHRRYLALTVGVPAEGRIKTLHGRDPRSRLRFSSKVLRGKEAVTNIALEESLLGRRAALVSCRLETGRTHQIRVHLAQERRTPILADELYGGTRGAEDVIEIARALGRQALHAAELGFVHPATQESLHFVAEMPVDMADALARLRG